jgi:hypothetical protein
MHVIVHGKLCVKINGRFYAVDTKQYGVADRIAMQSNVPSTYQRWQRSARNNHSRGFR